MLEYTHKLLYNTKVYLCGGMQYDSNGRAWRVNVKKELDKMGIISFDPYTKPFFEKFSVKEDENTHKKLKKLLSQGKYQDVVNIMRPIRSFDLSMCDKCDFAIVYLNPKIYTVGSLEELSQLNRCKKPVFCVFEGGKRKASLWLFGMIPHEYIFGSFKSVIKRLKDINDEKYPIDIKRWRLLDYKFR